MNNSTLKVYKASAGSGKTFTLVAEYIDMIVQNPEEYSRILAVTFTNKSTEEMKIRILAELYGIGYNFKDSESYLKKICKDTSLSEDIVRERSLQALSSILHNYNRFNVSTIDSFFQTVLRNLARELNLNANLRIDLNDAQVEADAVDRLIEDLKSKDNVLTWITNYLKNQLSEDKSYDIIKDIKKFGKKIFDDTYKSESKLLTDATADANFYVNYRKEIEKIKNDAVDAIKKKAEAFFDVISNYNLSKEDFSRKTVYMYFEKMRNGNFESSDSINKFIQSSDNWTQKTNRRVEEINQIVKEVLFKMLTDADKEREIQSKRYYSAVITLQNINQMGLLNTIQNKVRELNIDANRFLLSDTQQFLKNMINDSDAPFIFEKIGSRLEHIMIDEFQDTSGIQWENFRVLIRSCMDNGFRNIIVGDVKQSIYRWRYGDWTILEKMEVDKSPDEENVNYRSTKHVVDFNNAFFNKATNQGVNVVDEEAMMIQRAYSDLTQKANKNKENGSVHITLLPPDQNYDDNMLVKTVECIDDIINAGIPQNKIAVLVRSNSNIVKIGEYIVKNRPDLNVTSKESFRLDSSIAVNTIIEALHFLTHHDDILSQAKLVKYYQKDILKNDISYNQMFRKNVSLDTFLPEKYLEEREKLLSSPLNTLVEKIYNYFEIGKLESEGAFITRFYDCISEFVTNVTSDIDTFVDEWNDNLCSTTIESDDTDGITLLTVHKSKGLEFENVIIPFCDWALERHNLIWAKPDVAPYNKLPLISIDYLSKGIQNSIYAEYANKEHIQNAIDNMNILYVAFTRAKNNLFVIGKRSKSKKLDYKIRSSIIEETLPYVNSMLKGSKLEENKDDDEKPVLFTFGDILCSEEKKEKSDNPFKKEIGSLPIDIVSNINDGIMFRQSNDSKDFISTDEDKDKESYIQRGKILHKLYSLIKTPDDIDAAIQRLEFEGLLSDDITPESIRKTFNFNLKNPQVADWFSDRWQLINECTILFTDVNSKVCTSRPDRVMIDGNQAIVVDYKFGADNNKYKKQVHDYMSLLHSMGYKNVIGFLWYVNNNEIVEVR